MKIWKEEQTKKRRWPAPLYGVGNQVFLSTKNLNVATAYRKMAQEWIGPYTIIKVKYQTDDYTLKLRKEVLRFYPTFHVKLLKVHIPNDDKMFPAKRNMKPWSLQEFADDKHYEFDKILKPKTNPKNGTIHHLVVWAGWGHEHDSWIQSKISTKELSTISTWEQLPLFRTNQWRKESDSGSKTGQTSLKSWNYFLTSFQGGSMQECRFQRHSVIIISLLC